MSIINDLLEKKKALSPFITLKDGESIKVSKIKSVKSITKSGFNGEETEVLRLVCDIETSEGIVQKNFDNGSKKFLEALNQNGVGLGSSMVITREGEGPKTVYNISEVVNEIK